MSSSTAAASWLEPEDDGKGEEDTEADECELQSSTEADCDKLTPGDAENELDMFLMSFIDKLQLHSIDEPMPSFASRSDVRGLKRSGLIEAAVEKLLPRDSRQFTLFM